jgi:hypothetical protein
MVGLVVMVMVMVMVVARLDLGRRPFRYGLNLGGRMRNWLHAAEENREANAGAKRTLLGLDHRLPPAPPAITRLAAKPQNWRRFRSVR